MAITIKYFDEFDGIWKDVTGTSGQSLRIDTYGNINVQAPQWGDIGGDIGSQSDLKDELSIYQQIPNWVSYATGTTLVGFASTTTRVINYIQIGKLAIIQFNIIGTSNASNFTFTLPFSTPATSGVQSAIHHGVNGTTTQIQVTSYVTAGSSTVTLYNGLNVTAGLWTASGTKRVEGSLILLIA
jgi:hypothetical protein